MEARMAAELIPALTVYAHRAAPLVTAEDPVVQADAILTWSVGLAVAFRNIGNSKASARVKRVLPHLEAHLARVQREALGLA